MGKNSSPSAPAVPDYTAAANAQGQQSQTLTAQQTAANRPNISTPWGNLSWSSTPSTDPATGASVDQWSGNVSLTPQEQQALTAQQDIQAGKSGIAQNLLNTVGSQISGQPNVGVPQVGIPQAPGIPGQPNAAPIPQTPGIPDAPQLSQQSGAGQGINYDPTSNIQSTQDAVWNQFKNMQMPLQQQQTEQEQSQLEGQGLRPGDAAYDTAMKNLSNTQYTQQQTAENQALLAGQQEASTLNQEQLAAQGQGFGQNLAQTQYNNNIPGMENQLKSQGLGLQGQAGDLVTQQQKQQAAALGLTGMGVGIQSAEQGLTAEQLRQQQQMLGLQSGANTIAGQDLGLQQQALGTGQEQQAFGLNLLNGVMSGNQVSMPQFPNATPSGVAQTPQLLPAAIAQGNSALDVYNAQTGAANSGMAGIGSLMNGFGNMYSSGMFNNLFSGGSAGGGGGAPVSFTDSDRRLKTNIRRIARLASGLPVYLFRYIATPDVERIGVMADEAEQLFPDAVITSVLGFKMVNYGALA